MLQYLVFILLLVTRIVYLVKINDVDSFEWLTKGGEEKLILKIVTKDETIELPLRRAPFCHLAETKNCECFILRKGENSSQWDVASFVKCGVEVQGNFMSISRYSRIEPKKDGANGEHIIKNYEPQDSSSMGPHEQSAGEPDEEMPKGNVNSLKYFKPLPEYGQLFENETGYINTIFVVSESAYELVPKSKMDMFLQYYVNSVNQKMLELNLFIIYKGWTEASAKYKIITRELIKAFTDDQYAEYDRDGVHDAVILFGPVDMSRTSDSKIEALCHDTTGQFVKHINESIEIALQLQQQAILYSMARVYGIPNMDYDKCGKPPQGVVWIMEDQGASQRSGILKWGCSIEYLKNNRVRLACLRKKKIESSKPYCGNGLVEDGEECDCVVGECKRCCTEFCKLLEKSDCANGPCCDVSRCQVFNDTTQCRASQDFCDIPELCDGKSTQCPPNYVVANGYECKGPYDEKGYCFNGMCGNRGDVCGWAFLNGSNADDKCYEMNLENDKEWGGCGPTFQSKKTGGEEYFACSSDDKLCGKIYCTQPGIKIGGKMKFTNESRPYLQVGMFNTLYSGIRNYSSSICGYMGLFKNYRSLRIDPTFVPNGSECGDGKMCYKQTCRSLPSGCPKDCPGKKIKHPYTGEIFPAFELLGVDGGSWDLPSNTWLYYVFSFIFITLIIFGLGIAYSKVGESKSSISSSGTSTSDSKSNQEGPPPSQE